MLLRREFGGARGGRGGVVFVYALALASMLVFGFVMLVLVLGEKDVAVGLKARFCCCWERGGGGRNGPLVFPLAYF